MFETVSADEVRNRRLAGMTSAERAAYDEAFVEATARLEIAQMVYDARQAAGVTQTELAQAAGTRQNVISAIETGAKVPGAITLAKIAHALGCSLRIEPIAA